MPYRTAETMHRATIRAAYIRNYPTAFGRTYPLLFSIRRDVRYITAAALKQNAEATHMLMTATGVTEWESELARGFSFPKRMAIPTASRLNPIAMLARDRKANGSAARTAHAVGPVGASGGR